jgi:hypothetical protein
MWHQDNPNRRVYNFLIIALVNSDVVAAPEAM